MDLHNNRRIGDYHPILLLLSALILIHKIIHIHVVKTIQIIKIYSVFCISHATLKGLLYLIGRNNRPLPVI